MNPLELQDRLDQIVQSDHPLGKPKAIVNSSNPDPIGIIYIMLSAIGFGTIGLFAKLAYAHDLNPLSTQIWKLGGGALTLWIWVIAQTICHRLRCPELPKKDPHQNDYLTIEPGAIQAFLLGAVGYAAYSMSLFEAFSYATIGVTMLLFYTYPAFTALMRWAIFRHPLNRWQSGCLGFTLIGCIIAVDWQHQTSNAWGIVLGLSAAIGYAAYLIGSARIVNTQTPLQSASWMLSGATTTMVAIALFQTGIALPQDAIALESTLGLAIVSTALPIVFLYAGLKRIDLVPAAILSTLEPVVAIALGILFLGEPVWGGEILGGLCILASAILLQLRSS